MRDIVIGVLTKNEECTIIHVLNMVTAGLLDFFPEYDASILVADGNSTDRTIRLAESFRTPP
ncbi:MAG: glycosyltransferase [Methanocellales archaeon]|nr:glycosyltransferase [Methanocellales archaeon]